MNNFAVIGNPIKHSLSPYLHNYVYNLINIDAEYLKKEMHENELVNVIKLIRSGNLDGINITIPFKESIIEYLDEINPRAQIIGSVNIVYMRNNKLYGNNTDWYGFSQSIIKNNISIKNKEVIVLGAGGTAKAILFALKHLGVKRINLLNRTFNKAKKMQDEVIRVYEYAKAEQIIKNNSIIINTTSIGMQKDELPINSSLISKKQTLIDVIYSPISTSFIKLGESVGAKTLGGLDMFIFQALQSIDLWFGKTYSKQVNFSQLKTNLERKLC